MLGQGRRRTELEGLGDVDRGVHLVLSDGRAPDPATVRRRARLDGNQELKSDREEVEKMEGMLWRARAMVVQVAKQLAVKVRERLERSRGRSGPERGWSR